MNESGSMEYALSSVEGLFGREKVPLSEVEDVNLLTMMVI